jgi:hypothetical protein
MRRGPGAATRTLAKRLMPLFAIAATIALAGDPQGAGAAGGLLLAAALAMHLVVFGLARATQAIAPAVLRAATAWGVVLAMGAGVFAATGSAFDFIVVDVARTPLSIGGVLMHLAAFATLAGGGALAFQCVAARAGGTGP